ncbi:ComEC/Rec2 family competence protein [Candidatus Saccharibacteria bacterium]|nr:ComEC/Rec2 family competence protein [Candidatus Saccharibacteria bacterium]
MPKFLSKSLHQSYHFAFLCLGVIAGTILGLIFRINYFSSPIWLIAVIILFVYAYLKPKALFVILAFVTGLVFAFCRIAVELGGEAYIQNFYDQTIIVSGRIDGDPDSDLSGTKIKLKDLKFGPDQIPSAGSIYISARFNKAVKRNDQITVTGKLAQGFGTYAGYMYRPNITAINRPDPGDFIVNLRDWFASRIQQNLKSPEVALGLSYLLGMKTDLPEDLSENLRLVGLVHIVVASGAHLSILVEIAKKLFGKLSRASGLIFSILFIILFMALVGFTPSILRAGIMATLTLLAWYVGRKIAPWRIITIVAAITLLIDPTFIINLGWLLSFASFAGIMLLGPKITQFFYGTKKPKFIAETLITTISATIMTLPIILYFYGYISIISLAANLLILPTLSYAMGLTFLTGLTANIPGINLASAFLAEKLLGFHITVVNFLSLQTSFLIEIPAENPYIFLIYAPILFFIIIPYLKKPKHDTIKP